jgi:hypothetical protein
MRTYRKPGRRTYHPPSGTKWGAVKHKEQPRSEDFETILRFRCDKVCEEVDKKLRGNVKIYREEDWSQEYLRSLVPKSLI